jgi:hypothetical protein
MKSLRKPKGLIRIRKSNKERQDNSQMKRDKKTNNGRQNNTQRKFRMPNEKGYIG